MARNSLISSLTLDSFTNFSVYEARKHGTDQQKSQIIIAAPFWNVLNFVHSSGIKAHMIASHEEFILYNTERCGCANFIIFFIVIPKKFST